MKTVTADFITMHCVSELVPIRIETFNKRLSINAYYRILMSLFVEAEVSLPKCIIAMKSIKLYIVQKVTEFMCMNISISVTKHYWNTISSRVKWLDALKQQKMYTCKSLVFSCDENKYWMGHCIMRTYEMLE